MYVTYYIMEMVYHHIDYFFMINQQILNIEMAILYLMGHSQKFFLLVFVSDGWNVVHELPRFLENRKYNISFLLFFSFLQLLILKNKCIYDILKFKLTTLMNLNLV